MVSSVCFTNLICKCYTVWQAWRNTLHYNYILKYCHFQSRIQFDRPKWVPVWICVIYNSKLEPSLDVQTNIQCGFECDQCLPTQNLLRLFILLLLLILRIMLVQIWKLQFCHKAKLLFRLWPQGLVKILKFKFRPDLIWT